jgi:hypothetical protein
MTSHLMPNHIYYTDDILEIHSTKLQIFYFFFRTQFQSSATSLHDVSFLPAFENATVKRLFSESHIKIQLNMLIKTIGYTNTRQKRKRSVMPLHQSIWFRFASPDATYILIF